LIGFLAVEPCLVWWSRDVLFFYGLPSTWRGSAIVGVVQNRFNLPGRCSATARLWRCPGFKLCDQDEARARRVCLPSGIKASP
jgi:hypothetical protein